MNYLPPLPPRRGGESKVAKFAMLNQRHLDKINRGVPDAENEYRDFLIARGKYFFSLEEVLPTHQVTGISINSIVRGKNGSKRCDEAKSFLRSKAPDYVAQGGTHGVKEFLTTKKAMATSDTIAKSSSKGHSTNEKKEIWDVDIFARPLEEVPGSEIAHLLPDAAAHALEWYDVACWAIGTDPEGTDWDSIFRLLHGTNDSNKKRQFGCGLRHFVANKARINNQARLLDKNNPQLLVLPIRTREECLSWDGEAYEAIVLVGANENGRGQLGATKDVGMTDEDSEVFDASSEELQTALLLLKECTVAMAQSLVNYDPPDAPPNATDDEKEIVYEATALRTKRRELFINALAEQGVVVPKKDYSGPSGQYRGICKIRFDNDEDESNYFHPAPDPMLLVARAAVVWSVRNGFRLRASAVAVDDGWVAEREHDMLQLERWAKVRDAKKLKEVVASLEITVDQGNNMYSSDDDTLSASSNERGQADEEFGSWDESNFLVCS